MDNKAFKEGANRAKVSEVDRGVAAEVDSTEVAAEAEVILEVDHQTTLHPSDVQLKDKDVDVESPKRKRCPPSRYGKPVSHYIYVNYVDANVPNTFEEAMKSNDHKQWQIAMDLEINSLNKNNTWEIFERPKDEKDKSEVYVNQSKGYETGDNKVYKFQKALLVQGIVAHSLKNCLNS
ncbi:hypothetical protein EVAR_2314_1 [Eumeta japonica]|uniref:Retrovirus-related Pol polyprotein from transposon TNT 1-94 n=1 Tax=Eumeta variegata TaxID=151549 RepID=A0A4C1SFV1_EUMVA|nr:hypothetical protein EVAR_2314_1 [Eumeta japonica]